jgi:Peptidase family M23
MKAIDGLLVAGVRVRGVLMYVGLVVTVIGVVLGAWPLAMAGVVLAVVAFCLLYFLPAPRRATRVLRPPVAGRWLAVNSPATKVPSHGTHAYGQTYAVDLLNDPAGTGLTPTRWWPLTRRPDEYPSFGQPVFAPVDGVVAERSDWQRDHWSRTSWPALAWFFVEGFLRELTGPGRVLGNHLIIRVSDGSYVVLAHLRRRSATVGTGQRVRAGDQVGQAGNSGNTTEPHLHVQVMDHRWPLVAGGVPFAIESEVGDTAALPANGKHLVASGHAVGGDQSLSSSVSRSFTLSTPSLTLPDA